MTKRYKQLRFTRKYKKGFDLRGASILIPKEVIDMSLIVSPMVYHAP